MPAPIAVAVAQPQCVAGDLAANARAHADLVRAAGAQVVVFPELSLTGYDFAAPTVDTDDERLAPLRQACVDTGSIAFAGAPVTGEGGREHIGVLAVDGARVRVVYRKMWLGEAETRRFAPGNKPAVWEAFGWRLGLAVCRDSGIEQHAADTAALGIDAYLAGVLEDAADAEVIARRAQRIATEHRTWVAIASFAGSTGEGYANAAGRSCVVGPDGTVAAEAGAQAGAVTVATLR